MSYQQVVKVFRAEKNNYSKMIHELRQPITPKNDDGSNRSSIGTFQPESWVKQEKVGSA